MLPKRWRAVIWDFNGTLIDDAALAVRAINTQLSRRDLPLLDVDRYRRVFSFPLSEYHRALGFDLSAETSAALADEFHDAYLPGLPACRLHDGVRELLDRISGADIPQFVLSAMEETSLRAALVRLGIADRFEAIYGLGDRLASSKVARGHELIARFSFPAKDALLVGDTDHDVDVARALGTSVVLVAQGHQSAERLGALGVRVFETLHDLEATLLGGDVS